MAEVAGITLGSISLLMAGWDAGWRLWDGAKLTWRFGEDIQACQTELEMQYRRLQSLIYFKRISEESISRTDPRHENTAFVLRYISNMNKLLKRCRDLMVWYSKEENVGPYQATLDYRSSPNARPEPRPDVQTGVQGADKKAAKRRFPFFRKAGKTSIPEATSQSSKIEPNETREIVKLIHFISLEERAQSAEEKAKAYQEKVNYVKKMQWARKDMKEFETLLLQLKNSNDSLSAFLDSISIKPDPSEKLRVWEISDSIQEFWPNVITTTYVVGWTHVALMDANQGPKETDTFSLDVQLKVNHSESVEFLQGHNIIPNERSTVFNTQRWSREICTNDAHLLFVESAQMPPDSQEMSPHNILKGLSRPDEEKITKYSEDVEFWGRIDYLDEGRKKLTGLSLYHWSDCSFERATNLAEILGSKDYVRSIRISDIAKLAILLAYSHVYFEALRVRGNGPRSTDICYWVGRGEDLQDMTLEQLILNPWLSFGFGRKPRKPKFNSKVSEKAPQSLDMIELGLLLHQIGLGKPMDYDATVNSVLQGRQDALRENDKLAKKMGIPFADVVKGFLEFEPLHVSSLRAKAIEQEFMKRAVSALVTCERSLRNSPANDALLVDGDQQSELLVIPSNANSLDSSSAVTMIDDEKRVEEISIGVLS